MCFRTVTYVGPYAFANAIFYNASDPIAEPTTVPSMVPTEEPTTVPTMVPTGEPAIAPTYIGG